MTDIDRQALRDFMATEVMGWHIESTGTPPIFAYFNSDGQCMTLVSMWNPDSDSNNLDFLIDKMVEDGWDFELTLHHDAYAFAQFYNYPEWPSDFTASHPDRRLAVLLAIKAAKV